MFSAYARGGVPGLSIFPGDIKPAPSEAGTHMHAPNSSKKFPKYLAFQPSPPPRSQATTYSPLSFPLLPLPVFFLKSYRYYSSLAACVELSSHQQNTRF